MPPAPAALRTHTRLPLAQLRFGRCGTLFYPHRHRRRCHVFTAACHALPTPSLLFPSLHGNTTRASEHFARYARSWRFNGKLVLPTL